MRLFHFNSSSSSNQVTTTAQALDYAREAFKDYEEFDLGLTANNRHEYTAVENPSAKTNSCKQASSSTVARGLMVQSFKESPEFDLGGFLGLMQKSKRRPATPVHQKRSNSNNESKNSNNDKKITMKVHALGEMVQSFKDCPDFDLSLRSDNKEQEYAAVENPCEKTNKMQRGKVSMQGKAASIAAEVDAIKRWACQ